MANRELYIGIMSGTSLDGIDTALVEIDCNATTLLAYNDYPIPKRIREQVLDIALGQQTDLVSVGELDSALGQLYADAVNQLLKKAEVPASKITAIGNHGQTVYHQPTGATPFTMQLGDANIIAAKTGITTIADFRRKDIALGGQGAPLVPAFHRSAFSTKDSSLVVLNIGGIANISVLTPDAPTIGYDTGPGNTLLDAWILKHTGDTFDQGGKYAISGEPNAELLIALLDDPYFRLSAPKSTGRELFSLPWLEQKISLISDSLSPQDVQATLAEFTALTISNEVEKFAVGEKPELLVCGGGCKNDLLMQKITQLLPNWRVCTTDQRGISSDYMEAIAFAWLAYRRVHALPNNLPEVTGASRLASLGVIYPSESQEYSK